MLVFIDESGDPGFKVADGSSPVFVAAMVIFASAREAQNTTAAIAASEARRFHKGEFKFSKCRADVRDAFFRTVAPLPFSVRAIVVDKSVIRSPHLQTDKDNFYQFFVKQMLRNDNEVLSGARVRIDGSGDREFRRRLNTAIRARVREGAVKDVGFSDSATDPLIQLADMCAGAIARANHPQRSDRCRWSDMLRPRIDDVWRFR